MGDSKLAGVDLRALPMDIDFDTVIGFVKRVGSTVCSGGNILSVQGSPSGNKAVVLGLRNPEDIQRLDEEFHQVSVDVRREIQELMQSETTRYISSCICTCQHFCRLQCVVMYVNVLTSINRPPRARRTWQRALTISNLLLLSLMGFISPPLRACIIVSLAFSYGTALGIQPGSEPVCQRPDCGIVGCKGNFVQPVTNDAGGGGFQLVLTHYKSTVCPAVLVVA